MRRDLIAIVAASVLAMAGAVDASPLLEIRGGTEEIQSFAGTQIIPNGAHGFENRILDPAGPANPMSIVLVGEPNHTYFIRFEYVGSDATFTNLFENSLAAGGGNIQWCNKLAGCDGYAALGAGNQNWFGNFSATASMSLTTDGSGEALVPFLFQAGALGSDPNGPHLVPNGGSIFDAHFGAFNLDSGFDFANFDRTARTIGLGLTDGALSSETDDDHQDFMLRVTAVPWPGTLALTTLTVGLFAIRRRRAS